MRWLPCCCGCTFYTIPGNGMAGLSVDSGSWSIASGSLVVAAGGGQVHSVTASAADKHFVYVDWSSPLDANAKITVYPNWPDTGTYARYDNATGAYTLTSGGDTVSVNLGTPKTPTGFLLYVTNDQPVCDSDQWFVRDTRCIVSGPLSGAIVTAAAPTGKGFAIKVENNTGDVTFSNVTGSRITTEAECSSDFTCSSLTSNVSRNLSVTLSGTGSTCDGGTNDGDYVLTSNGDGSYSYSEGTLGTAGFLSLVIVAMYGCCQWLLRATGEGQRANPLGGPGPCQWVSADGGVSSWNTTASGLPDATLATTVITSSAVDFTCSDGGTGGCSESITPVLTINGFV
ncbi:MAG: hypothetical protein JSS27_00970 [Planctomycetes bacterium]|nr:hypothetical protein [Planctomycetota bacterium]